MHALIWSLKCLLSMKSENPKGKGKLGNEIGNKIKYKVKLIITK